MTSACRHVVARSAAVLVLGSLASSCSRLASREPGSAGTSGQEPAFVRVETSSLFVTIENRSGQPLLDLRIAIKPVGGATEYTKLVTRLESTDKRDFSLGDFGGRDGTPFMRVVRPKEIAVTAVGLTGQKFAMTVPWKQ